MTLFRIIAVSSVAFTLGACAGAPFKENAATRLGTDPLASYYNPKIKAEVSHTFSSNESDLASIAERIEAEAEAAKAADEEAFAPIADPEDSEDQISSRASVSLL